jgi:hypothetical protein
MGNCGTRYMSGRRIPIVEDEYWLGEGCASLAREAGFEVVGPFLKLEDVRLDLDDIAGALVNINLCGSFIYPLLDRLLERNIAVTLYTGYDSHLIPQKYGGLGCVVKPSSCKEARTYAGN